MLDEFKHWYNGYDFALTEQTVYNPFSILNCFSKNKFSNYWFTSGTTNFLIQALAQNPRAAEELIQINTWQIAASDLDAFSEETYYKKLNTLFVQTGYLTFAGYNPASDLYSLKYRPPGVGFCKLDTQSKYHHPGLPHVDSARSAVKDFDDPGRC